MSKTNDIGKQLLFLIERNRLDDAENLLAKAITKDPEDLILAYFEALLDFKRGRLDQAESAAAKLLLKKPEDEASRYLLFQISQEREDTSQALQRIADLCQDNPHNAEYRASHAAQLLYNEHYSEALKEAQQALKLDPQSKVAQEILAYSMLACGNKQVDQQLLERLRSDPNSESTQHLLVTALVQKKAYPEALQIARKLLMRQPKNEELVTVVKELQVLAHPSQRLFFPFDWLEAKGIKKIYVISGLMVGVLKSATEGDMPLFLAILILGYLISAGVWSWLLRRWL